MEKISWQEQFNGELAHAEAARAFGNEGMARVCARRAVGIIAGEYLRRRGISNQNPSAYDRINYLLALDSIPADVQHILEHFLLRINIDHNLPVDADLIGEASWLKEALLNNATIAGSPDE